MTAPSPERLAAIRLLIVDVDGVLTDGRIIYDSEGRETKVFHVRDGAAIKQLRHSGLEIGIITGRASPMVDRRASELGVTAVLQGAEDKFRAFEALQAKTPGWDGIPLNQCACIGDDLADLALFDHFGLRLTVADAHPAVIAAADWVSALPGGAGVMREVAELLLRHTPTPAIDGLNPLRPPSR
ncbi:MAG: HAD hydrolase family protein [Pseudomonadota bacterium]